MPDVQAEQAVAEHESAVRIAPEQHDRQEKENRPPAPPFALAFDRADQRPRARGAEQPDGRRARLEEITPADSDQGQPAASHAASHEPVRQ